MILSVCQPMIDIRYVINVNFLKMNNLESNGYTEVRSKEHDHKLIRTDQDTNRMQNKTTHINEVEDHIKKLSKVKNLPQPECKMAGGSCLNTLRMIAKKSKIEVTFIGAIGNDEGGKELIQILKKDDANNNTNYSMNEDINCTIKYFLEKVPKKNTAKCQVFLSNNERSLLTDLGAANSLSLKYLQNNTDAIQNAKIIYICAFFANSMTENAYYVMERLQENQMLIFNISNQDVVAATDYNLLKIIISRSDVLIGNKEEFYALYKRMIMNENVDIKSINKENANAELAKNNKFLEYFTHKKFICTDGKNQISYCEERKIQTVNVEKLNNEKLDTCGAGDFFAAGVIECLYKKRNFEEAIKQGKEWAKEYILVNSKKILNLM